MSKDTVYAAIKQHILVGRYRPGDPLNERELMDEYAIGKTPLREVFFRLQSEGLIRRFARIGTIVAPIDTKKVYDVAEIRFYLEGIVARLAVRRISAAALEAMSATLQKMEEVAREENHSAFAAEEAALHNMLYTAAGNVALKEFIEAQYSLFTRIWFSVDRTPVDLTEQLNHWKAICQALRERDEEKAVASNRKHFEVYFDRLKSMR
jgi:DNA-binding GntR family transcriptional regulator